MALKINDTRKMTKMAKNRNFVTSEWRQNVIFQKKKILSKFFSENFQHDRLGKNFPFCDYLGQNSEKCVFLQFSQFRNTKSLPNGWISQTSYSWSFPAGSKSNIGHTYSLNYITSIFGPRLKTEGTYNIASVGPSVRA